MLVNKVLWKLETDYWILATETLVVTWTETIEWWSSKPDWKELKSENSRRWDDSLEISYEAIKKNAMEAGGEYEVGNLVCTGRRNYSMLIHW